MIFTRQYPLASESAANYLCRAKNITNKPRINEDPKDAMLREFQEEIAKLKAQLAAKQAGGGGAAAAGADVDVSWFSL